MFIQITNDGTYLGSSSRSTEGYFPVSHELSKSLRSRVIKSASNVRRAIGTTPAPVVVGIDELWKDIKEDPYSLVETYADIYSQLKKIDLTVIVYVKSLREELNRNVDKIVDYFVMGLVAPTNLYDVVVSISNGVEIVEADYSSNPPSPPETPDEQPAPSLPDPIPVVEPQSDSDGKQVKEKRTKSRGGSGARSDSKPSGKGDGVDESSSKSSD